MGGYSCGTFCISSSGVLVMNSLCLRVVTEHTIHFPEAGHCRAWHECFIDSIMGCKQHFRDAPLPPSAPTTFMAYKVASNGITLSQRLPCFFIWCFQEENQLSNKCLHMPTSAGQVHIVL